MKKIFTLFCLALLSLGALADNPVLFVKPWFAPKVDGYSWGGALESLYATGSKYLMTKVDGYDNLYKCSMALNKEYDQVADAKGNTKTATDYYFNVVTTTTPGKLMSNAWNKNCGSDGSDALVTYPQAFTVPADGTTVTFYALYDATTRKVRSWCDAGTIDVRNTGGVLMDRHIPAAIGKTTSTCLFPLEEAAGQPKATKVEIRLRLDWGSNGIDNNNYIWPNNKNSGSKYAVGSYTRAPMMKATFDATTFKIAVSQYWSDNEIPSYTLHVGDAGVATLVLPFDAPIPTGVSAYTLDYTSQISEDSPAFLDIYREKSLVLNHDIRVYKGTYRKDPTSELGGIPAKALAIDNKGGLEVIYTNGERETLTTGEVTIRL